MGTKPAVLVTGAAGYVGRPCVAALAERMDELSALVALDWSETARADQLPGVVYEQADICDPALKDLLRKHRIDTVVHLASIVRSPKGAPKDLAYRVDDIYATCQRLMDGGVTINRPPRDGHMAFVRSPDGISIELLQTGEALPPEEPWASMENTGNW